VLLLFVYFCVVVCVFLFCCVVVGSGVVGGGGVVVVLCCCVVVVVCFVFVDATHTVVIDFVINVFVMICGRWRTFRWTKYPCSSLRLIYVQ